MIRFKAKAEEPAAPKPAVAKAKPAAEAKKPVKASSKEDLLDFPQDAPDAKN